MTTNKQAEPIQLESTNPLDDRLDQLRDLFPEAFAEGRLDLDKLHATAGHFVEHRPQRYTSPPNWGSTAPPSPCPVPQSMVYSLSNALSTVRRT